jgi:N-acyl homoserine lactone hydrolase
MKNMLKKLAALAGIGALAGLTTIACGVILSPALAQKPPMPGTMKLYVLDCGIRLQADPAQGGLPGGPIDRPTPCFLIVHPKGTLMWETGTNDNAPYAKGGFNPTKGVLKQLTALGYPPSKIDYLSVSHYHGDHAGNVGYFTNSTWLVEKDMRETMFGPGPGETMPPDLAAAQKGAMRSFKDWNGLKDVKTVIIPNKDYDVFGDGSVVILSTPASTPGHESLFVNLPKTGPIVIGGDIYTDVVSHEMYLQYTHQESKMHVKPFPQSVLDTWFNGKGPGGEPYVTPAYLASMNKVEKYVADHHAQFWIQHDGVHFMQLKKAPQYYE